MSSADAHLQVKRMTTVEEVNGSVDGCPLCTPSRFGKYMVMCFIHANRKIGIRKAAGEKIFD